MKKFLFSLVLILLSAFFISSCKKGSGGVYTTYPFDETTAAEESTSYDRKDLLDVKTSWQSKYALSYSYYDIGKGETKITEGKTDKFYQSIDNASGITTYMVQNNGYISEFMLNPREKSGTQTVVADSTLRETNSGFVLLSACDPYFPVYKNVEKIGRDDVCRRKATRFKQKQFSKDGKLQKIAYVWIDDEYSFCSKCELYRPDGALLMRWELLSFTQSVKEEDVRIDTSSFKLTAS